MRHTVNSTKSNHQILLEFLDAFLEEFPRLPLKCEIPFTIELKAQLWPISKPLYCMIIIELQDLHMRLQNILKG